MATPKDKALREKGLAALCKWIRALLQGIADQTNQALDEADEAITKAAKTAEASGVKFTDGQTFQQKYDTGQLTGPSGADGKDGAPGKDGTNGTNGKDGKDGADGKDAPFYTGSCTTAAATVAKTATVSGFTLEAGAVVFIKMTNANSATAPTLNVNSTGAKPIMRYGTTAVSTSAATSWNAGAVVPFQYDGTNWVIVGWLNSTYSNASLGQGYGTCTTAAATVEKAVTLSSYSLSTGGIVAVKFSNDVPAGATMNINSKGAKAIYYDGAAIKAGVIRAGDVAGFVYNGSQYHLLFIDRMAGPDELPTATLAAGSWKTNTDADTKAAGYTMMYSLAVSGALAADSANCQIAAPSESVAAACGMCPGCDVVAGAIQFYAVEKPSAAITVQYELIRGG